MEEINLNDFLKRINAYRQSRILLTAFELKIFTALENTDGSLESICNYTQTNLRATRMLLNALTGYGIIKKREKCYSNTDFSGKYLAENSADYLSGLAHSNNLWENWADLTQSVKTGKPKLTSNDKKEDKWLSSFIEAMHRRGISQAVELVKRVDIENVSRVLDVGGGSGIFAMEFVKAKKGISATIFDLPEVIALTKQYINYSGLSSSIDTQTGNYLYDEFGSGYDLVLLSAIVHSNSGENNILLLKKCWNCLKKEGRIVISDFIMNEDRTSPLYGAEFALNMLVATNEGNTYTLSEIQAWFEKSGFQFLKKIEMPGKGSLVFGQKI